MILVRMSSAGKKVCCCLQWRFTALMPRLWIVFRPKR